MSKLPLSTPQQSAPQADDTPPAPRLLDRLRALELFVPQPPGRVTRRQALIAAVAFVVGTAVAVSRTRGPGALNSIWAEDGQNFLHDALTMNTVDAVTTPFNGYWHLIPRLLAEIAVLFPLDLVPAVLSIGAAAVVTALAILVYTVSGAYFTHPALRLLAAVPVALAPAGIGWVENNVATLQFPLLYGLFWTLLWVPRARAGRVLAVTIVTLIAFTTPLALVFVPLAVLRLVMRPSKTGLAIAAGLAAGLATQFGGAALGYASRAGLGEPRYGDPVWAVYEFMTRVVPVAMLGEKWSFDGAKERLCPEFVVLHHDEHRLLVFGSWLIAAAAVAIAVRYSRPAWALAVIAAAHSLLIWSVTIMSLGCSAHRYLTAPALLLFATAAALLRPREGKDGVARLAAPAVVLLTFFAVVLAVNVRTDGPRADGPAWSDVLRDARAQCEADPAKGSLIVYTRWAVELPCDALRK